MSKFLTDRVRKTAPDKVSADRYKFIKLSEAEPDLGVPGANGSFFVSGTDGVRSWTDKLNTTANGVTVNGELLANSLDISGLANLGNLSNVKILGGNTGQVISTDGSGNLTFIDPTGGLDVDGGQTPFFIPEGETFTVVENRQAFFQLPITIDGDLVVDGILVELPSGETTDDLIEGNTNLFFTEARFNTSLSTYDGNIDTSGNITANVITANILQGDGSLITNLSIGSGTFIENGSSEVRVDTNSNVRVSVAGTANVLVVTSTGANIGGYANVTGNIGAGNVSATDVSATTLGGTLTTASQPNVTSVGTLSSLDVTGNVSAGNVSGTLLTGTLTTNAQPNITSVGTLDSLSVTGNISGNVVTADTLTVNGETTVTGNIVPSANNTYNLGAPDKVWKELYLGSNTLFIDGVPLSIANGSLTFGNNAVVVSGDTNVSTDDIAEGEVNLYFTSNRANTAIENFDGNINTSGSITANSFSGNISGNVTGQVSDISNHTTSNLTEGTNLYFTQTRARESISAIGDLSYDSTNGVFSVTTYKGADFDTDFANKSTTNLTEGTNLYFTETRARESISGSGNINYNNSTGVISQSLSTTDITEGTNLYFTTERVRGNISAGGDLNYDSTNGVFSVTTYKSADFNNDFANKTTSNLSEGTNLYFTETRARNSFSSGTGVTLNTGVISIGQDVSTNANVSFNRVSNLASPIGSTDATNKQYVDEVAQGLKARTAARVLTDQNLSATYNNGTAGVGATLTADSNGAFPTTDGVDSAELNQVSQRILVIGQTNKAHNGLYVVQVAGDAETAWQLRRCVECDEDSEIPGSFVFVKEGTTYGATGWVAITDLPFTVGTTAINWTQFSGAGTFLAGTGLTLTGNEFSVNSSQTQITELGTLTGLNVNGNIIAANITANTGVISGNGAGLSNLVGANVTGTVANASHSSTANTVVDAAQPNITSVGTLDSLSVTGNVSAGNVSGTLLTGTLATNAQPNVTSVGTLTSLDVTGNVSAGNVSATDVSATTLGGTLTTASQPNVTSVGTLTGLGVNGNIVASNITANTGTFTGNGSGLSALTGANVTGQVGNALVAGTVYTAAQPNITSVGTLSSLSVTGNLEAGNISTGGTLNVTGNAIVGNIGASAGVFTNVSGNGSLLTALNANSLSTGTVPSGRLSGSYSISVDSATTAGTVTTNAQPNITSVGTLTELSVTGNASAGNLAYTGTLTGGTGVVNLGSGQVVKDASGNVGVGTTAPTTKLMVSGASETTAAPTDAGTKASTLLIMGGAEGQGSGGTLSFGAFGHTFAAIKGFILNATGNGVGDLCFSTRNTLTDTSLTERMRITERGNVGIGTNGPAGVFHVRDAGGDKGTIFRDGRIDFVNANNSAFSNAVFQATEFKFITGSLVPSTNATQDLGSDTLRWNTVYTSDLSLKNDHGDWTIVEGEDDLFLYNNKKDKVYKFSLTEVDPKIAPPKRD